MTPACARFNNKKRNGLLELQQNHERSSVSKVGHCSVPSSESCRIIFENKVLNVVNIIFILAFFIRFAMKLRLAAHLDTRLAGQHIGLYIWLRSSLHKCVQKKTELLAELVEQVISIDQQKVRRAESSVVELIARFIGISITEKREKTSSSAFS